MGNVISLSDSGDGGDVVRVENMRFVLDGLHTHALDLSIVTLIRREDEEITFRFETGEEVTWHVPSLNGETFRTIVAGWMSARICG